MKTVPTKLKPANGDFHKQLDDLIYQKATSMQRRYDHSKRQSHYKTVYESPRYQSRLQQEYSSPILQAYSPQPQYSSPYISQQLSKKLSKQHSEKVIQYTTPPKSHRLRLSKSPSDVPQQDAPQQAKIKKNIRPQRPQGKSHSPTPSRVPIQAIKAELDSYVKQYKQEKSEKLALSKEMLTLQSAVMEVDRQIRENKSQHVAHVSSLRGEITAQIDSNNTKTEIAMLKRRLEEAEAFNRQLGRVMFNK